MDFTHDHANISDSDLCSARSTRHPLKKILFQKLQSNMRLTCGPYVNNASTYVSTVYSGLSVFFYFFHAVDLERIASIALSSLSDVEVLQSSQAEAEGKAEDREDRSHNGGHGYYVHHKQSY